MAFGPIHKCCKWHFRPSPPDIFWADQGLWNLMSVQHLSNFVLAFSLLFWERLEIQDHFFTCFLRVFRKIYVCLFWAHYALAQEVSKFKSFAGVFPGYMGLIWFSLGLGGKFYGHGKGIPFQTLSPWYLLRRWGSLKLDVSSAPFKMYVRITCLVPLKGFHFGSILNWLSKCEILSVLWVCSQATWV